MPARPQRGQIMRVIVEGATCALLPALALNLLKRWDILGHGDYRTPGLDVDEGLVLVAVLALALIVFCLRNGALCRTLSERRRPSLGAPRLGRAPRWVSYGLPSSSQAAGRTMQARSSS